MIELVATICLMSAPERCRDMTLTFEAENVSPLACVMNGQIELSKWTEGHPGWKISRFTCRPAGQVAKL
jgi:hypothetical protein